MAKFKEQASLIEVFKSENIELKRLLAERDVTVNELEARLEEMH
jgi:hypothetical protein